MIKIHTCHIIYLYIYIVLLDFNISSYLLRDFASFYTCYHGLHWFTSLHRWIWVGFNCSDFFRGLLYGNLFFLNYQLHQSHPISVVPNIFCPIQNLVGVPVTLQGVGKWVWKLGYMDSSGMCGIGMQYLSYYIPKCSMVLEYLPTFTLKITEM